jgi:aminoglycoside phosphotransferase (APT) family kinase protein
LVDRAQLANVTVVPTLAEAFDGNRFDGLVAVLFGNWRSKAQRANVKSLVRAAATRVDDGFVLVAAANALAYNGDHHRLTRALMAWGAGALERLVSVPGRQHARSWPVLLHRDAPFEILHGPYGAVSQNASTTERVKRWMLGAAAGRWLAPGYIVLSRCNTGPLLIDEVLQDVAATCEIGVDIERHLTMPDKTIFLTRRPGETSGHIVVLPRTERAVCRRAHEVDVLRQASMLPPRLRDLFPTLAGAGTYRGQRWMAMEKMPGTFVDAPVKDLDALTCRAADILMDLHLTTRHEVQIDEATYERLVGRLTASARRRHSGCAELLAQVDLALRAALLGSSLPLVWMHGDYKIENVGIDSATRQPVSIIDWELAEPSGLPLIDLLYLLTYNRMIRRQSTFAIVYQEVLAGAGWGAQETQMLERYAQTLDLDAQQRELLATIFVVHAVGARLQYDMNDPEEKRQCTRLLETSRNRLVALAPACAGGAA